MPTPSSGIIRFSDLSNEFGPSANISLGAYRINKTVGTLSNLPLDSGVPQSGSISMSQFYNKRLNIVINYTNLPDNSTRLNARQSYDNGFPGNIVVIGGFRPKPTVPQNIRLFINTNTRIGSASGARTTVALRTGNWRDSNNNALTSVTLECGPSSKIYGAGGQGGSANGGGGGNGTSAIGIDYPTTVNNQGRIQRGGGGGQGGSANGGGGGNGTSAIGIDYPTTVNNQGRIQRGGGGGGAGASASFITRSGKKRRRKRSNYSTGGGGGGGAGFPFGAGGPSVGGAHGPSGSNGSGGASGSHESAGSGGAGGSNAGSGGSGGQFGNGSPGGSGGGGGDHGFAFVIGPGGSKSGGGGTIIGGDENAEPT